jgi:hypothetical protein
MKRDYKLSCLSDSDMRQYEFIRNSRLPRGSFDDDPWWKPSQDAVVFWVCVIVGVCAILWSH